MSLFERCKLEGYDLDYEVARLEGKSTTWNYSTNWAVGGPIIERDQIYLRPPRNQHINYGPGNKRSGWHRQDFWTATVSAKTRKRPNPNDNQLKTVGRGAGETALIAAMRAYVDSKKT